jgi:hypothetical protein
MSSLSPTTCPWSLMLLAVLLNKPGRPPRLIMVPPMPFHSVAIPVV